MGISQQEEKWYSGAIDLCFDGAENVKESAFLKIFAAPMCAPCNSNFGKAKDARKSGAASKSMQRLGEDIFRDQQILLGKYETHLKKYPPDGENVRQRVSILSDNLVVNLIRSEDEYLKKNTNYKSQAFLSFYLSGQEAESRNLLYRVSEFYADVLVWIYGGDEVLNKRSSLMQKQLENMAPGFYIPERYQNSGSRRAGYCLCAGLILSAVEKTTSTEDFDRLYALLGLTPPEAGNTLSIPSVENVTMKLADFGVICGAALRAPLELEAIEVIFRTLKWIRTKADGHLDGDSRLLVEQFVLATNEFCKRELQLIMDDMTRFEKLQPRISKATEIVKACESWIR